MADGNDNKARDAKMIKTMLESLGVKEYEPAVIDKFQEVYYRTTMKLLTDAQKISNHAGKATIDIADVQLAIKSTRHINATQPPSKEVKESAMEKSATAIPRPPSDGVLLPPETDVLITSKDLEEINKKCLDEIADKQKGDANASTSFPNNTSA